VHIYIDNFCNTSVSPTSINASLSTGVMLEFHNHSVDYDADVWSSRNYGYLDMAMGYVWEDPIMHCRGPMPYSEYFDISIAGGGTSACPSVRFTMNCQ
jgi:hypothetical protein